MEEAEKFVTAGGNHRCQTQDLMATVYRYSLNELFAQVLKKNNVYVAYESWENILNFLSV